MLAQRRFQEHDGIGARPEADDLLALEHGPVELLHRLARQKEEAVGGGQPGEDLGLDRRFAVVDVDGRLGPDQHDVGAAGQQGGHALVGALRGLHGHVQARVLEIALRQGHVLGHVKNGPHHFFVADLHGGIEASAWAAKGANSASSAAAARRGDGKDFTGLSPAS